MQIILHHSYREYKYDIGFGNMSNRDIQHGWFVHLFRASTQQGFVITRRCSALQKTRYGGCRLCCQVFCVPHGLA